MELSGPTAIGDDALRFPDGYKLVASNIWIFFRDAARPVNLEISSGRFAETKVKSRIVAGIET